MVKNNSHSESVFSNFDALKVLRNAKLRPTKQRVSLVLNIFKYGNRHINAENLYKEVLTSGDKISLATVYNTLHHLTRLGLVRQVKVNSSHNYFDTNVEAHHHFYDESNNSLTDISQDEIKIHSIPLPPKNKKISEVELIISIKNK